MELRSRLHMHHIQAIKGRLVEKVLNVNYCGQPTLKFKAVKDIYDAEDARKHNQVPTVNLRDNIESSSPFKLKHVKLEVQSDSEASELNRKNGGDEKNDDSDFSGDMTLGQIKGRCRTKKRKRSNYVSPVKESVETFCSVNRVYPYFEQEDISDMEEPLIILKRKVSKNVQSKKKRSRKQVPASSRDTVSAIESQQRTISQESPESNDDKPAPIKVKVEVSVTEHSGCRAMICFRDDSPFSCYDKVYSTEVASNEIPETTDASTLDAEFEGYPPEDSLNGVDGDIPDQFEEDVNPAFGAAVTGWEIVMVDSPEMLASEFSDIPEFSSSSHIIPYISHDVSTDSLSSIDDPNSDLPDDSTDLQCQQNHCSEAHDSINCSSAGHDMSAQARCQGETQLPEMAPEINLHCSENIDRGDDDLFEDINKGGSSKLEESAIGSSGDHEFTQSLKSSESTIGHSVPASLDLPSAEKQSSSSTVAEGPHEHVGSPKLGDCDNSKLHTPSQRLTTTRKSISPTSQERLRRALETTLLGDNEHPECRGKLYFAKKTNHRILKAEGLQQFSGPEITPILRKPKHAKSVLKDPRLSRSAPQPARCTSAQSYSENAIAFSNRQMRDIEALATKLTKEIKSMKDIMKGRLQLEETTAPTSKQNSDELVRTAIDNATRAEETTKRWLSMMSRDCSRFCKIMKMTEERSASENSLQKKRKITFADEAGEKLCHVKLFKNDAEAPSMEPGHETQTVLDE